MDGVLYRELECAGGRMGLLVCFAILFSLVLFPECVLWQHSHIYLTVCYFLADYILMLN